MAFTQSGGGLSLGGESFSGAWSAVINNVYKMPQIIAMESMYRLMPRLFLPRISGHKYQKYFDMNKIGNTINIRLPYQTNIVKRRRFQPQPMIERTTTLKIGERWHWGANLGDEEMTTNLQKMEEFIDTGVEKIAVQMDVEGYKELCEALYLTEGTPGMTLNTKTMSFANAKAETMDIPNGMNKYLLADPYDIANLGEDIKGKAMMESFAQQVVRQRYMGDVSGYAVFSSVNPPLYRVADEGSSTPLVMGANQEGSSIQTDGWDTAKNGDVILNKGTMIKFAGVKFLKPTSKETSGQDATFTVTEDVIGTANGRVSIPISPELNSGTLTTPNAEGGTVSLNAYRNVDKMPADNAAVTVIGTPGNNYRQGVLYQKDCLEMVNIHLKRPFGLPLWGYTKDKQTGIGMTVAADSDIEEMDSAVRVDCVWAWKALRPELGLRVITEQVR